MKNEWWKSFYDENLAQVLLRPKDNNEAEKTVSFLTRELSLKPKARLFDQCCGNGRVSIPLAKNGFEIIGIDLAEGYISEAQSRAQAEADVISTKFQIADAFTFSPQPLCDGALNWWTSFGYAETDSQNQLMIDCAYQALKPGAGFALDYMNVPGIYHSFQPYVLNEQPTPQGNLKLERTSIIDFYTGRLKKTWLYTLPSGEQQEHHTSTCLYSPQRLISFFEASGFTNIRLFGDLDSSPLTLHSPRAIICGTKPTSKQ